MMNVSLPFYRPFLYLLVLLLVPTLVHAQYAEHELLKNDSITVQISSSGNGLQIEQQPTNGSYFLNGIPNGILGGPENDILYIPDSSFLGSDTLVVLYYQDSPFGPMQSYLTYIFTVVEAIVNAKDDYALTAPGASVIIDVLSNDEGSGEALSFYDTPLVNNGNVSIADDGSLTYTPNEGFNGIARFTYTVCDSEEEVCDVATVIVFVDDVTGSTDTTQIVTLKNQSLRALFPIVNGQQQIRDASNGDLNYLDGGVLYTPDDNFVGKDTFTYAYNMNDQTSLATYVIDVLYADDPNGYAINDLVYVSRGDTVLFNVLDNDLNNALAIQSFGNGIYPSTIEHLGGGLFRYIAPSWLNGLDQFEYTAMIPGTTSAESAKVSVLVNNHLPALEAYDLSTSLNSPLVINYDIPINNFSFTAVSSPDNGNLVIYDGPSSDHSDLNSINGQAVIGNNVVVYYPNQDFIGNDQFELQYCVGNDCKNITVYASVQGFSVVDDSEEMCVSDCVWAGDTNLDGAVTMVDLLPIGYAIGTVGEERIDASVEWYPQYANEWDENLPASNNDLKHVDTDGDGLVSAEDTVAVNQYYGLYNNITSGANPAGSSVPLFFVPQNPNPAPGDLVEVDIILGTVNNPATNVHGITFALNFNEDIVKPGTMKVEYDQGNWLGYGNTVMDMMKEPWLGRVESGYTRTTGRAAHGYGKIGVVSFIVVDDIIDGNRLRDTIKRVFLPDDLVSMNLDGQFTEFTSETFELNIAYDLSDPLDQNDDNLIVYPNPASDIINVHVNGNNELEQIIVRSITGQVVLNMDGLSGKQERLLLDDRISNGIYLITAICDRGVFSKKVKLVR